MIRTFAAAAALTALLAAAGPATGKDPALEAAVDAYMRHPVTQRIIDDMWSVDTMRSTLVAQLRARGANLRGDQLDTLTRIVHEELKRVRPAFETLMKDAVLEPYTLEEIGALHRFLETELGGRAMAKSGAMMRSFNAGSAPLLRGMFKRMAARLKAELAR